LKKKKKKKDTIVDKYLLSNVIKYTSTYYKNVNVHLGEEHFDYGNHVLEYG